jgi:hypothetical protein
MKKIIFVLITLVFIASSCIDDKIPVPTAIYVGEKNAFTLSANGETREIEVMTTAPLKLEKEEDVDWCNIELVENNKLVVTVQPNARLVGRSTTAKLVASDKELELVLEQSGQPSIAMAVSRAEASSTAAGYDLGVSYDGDLGNGFFVTLTTDPVHEVIYFLEPTDKVQLVGITYYPRLPNAGGTVANGNFSTGSILVSQVGSPENFQKVMDFDVKRTIQSAFLEFPAAQTNVHAVKLVINGGAASQAGGASFREVVFNGTAVKSAAEKFVLLAKKSYIFSENGETTAIGVLSNSESITATSSAAWCTVSVDGSFINLTATANTGSRQTADITVTGSEGGSQTIAVQQLAPSSLLEVTAATAVNVRGEVNTGEGSIGSMYDNNIDQNYWHSDYSNSQSLANAGPYQLEFDLANVGQLSHIRYYPRRGNPPTLDTEGKNQGGNGNFGRIEVWVKSGSDYTKATEFQCGEKGDMSEIVLPTPAANVTNVRILIISGRGGHGSCSEMQFLGVKK